MLTGIVVDVSMAVPAMHEQMQQRAQQEQDIRERTENMRPVFRDEKKRGNSKEREQDQPTWRPCPAMLLGWIIAAHGFLL
jgi:hypothetical protein